MNYNFFFNNKKSHILNKNHHKTKITTRFILIKIRIKKWSQALLNLSKNFNMWLITFTLKKIIWLIIYIFMIKNMFNFKSMYMYPLMNVLHAFLKNNLTNYLYFIIKIVFNFKYIYVFT